MSPRARELRGASPAQSSRRTSALAALGVFLLLFAVYHATLVRTVVDQDSGELVAAAHVLGIAHPTGYPLWVLLGRCFDFLPVGGTSAYRVGLLSAVSTAAAGAIVTALAAGLTGALLPAILAGLAYGLWFPAWSQAVRAEVYGLTALLVALALAAFFAWERGRSPKALGWFALAVGFVAMHHRTAMLMIAPALIAAAVLTRPRSLRLYAGVAGLFLAPFACYVYLPIRAAARPPLNWTDPITFDRFVDHVLATQYQHFAFSHSLEQMAEQAVKLAPQVLAPSPGLAAAIALVGIPLIAWGWRRWTRKRPIAGWSLAIGAALLCVWVLQWGETSDLKVFFVPMGQVLAVAGAFGLGALAASLHSRRGGSLLSASVGILLCAALIQANWARADLSNLWEHRDRWVTVLSQMQPNAVFVSDFDVPSFATLYLQNVEDLRQDVTLLRAVRMPDRWYIDLIQDEALRKAAADTWTATGAAGLDVHDRTALFAFELARRLEGRRPVYCLHPPRGLRLEGPPYFVGVSIHLFELRFEQPQPEAARPVEPIAEFQGGVSLEEFELEKGEAKAGELLRFRSRWRLTEPLLSPAQFGVELYPEDVGRRSSARRPLSERQPTHMYPLLSGQWQTAPLPQDMVWRQEGLLMVPSNCRAGRWTVAVGVGPLYATENAGSTPVGEVEISAAPLPSNPP
jgi:MFS family permease